jgi:integrase
VHNLALARAFPCQIVDDPILDIVLAKEEYIFKRRRTKALLRHPRARLQWSDVDFERSLIICNKPEKGSLPRVLPISPTLKSMLSDMPRKDSRIFTCTLNSMYASYRQLRKTRAFTLKNERLKEISFHDLRKFFATKHHAKYLNVPKT